MQGRRASTRARVGLKLAMATAVLTLGLSGVAFAGTTHRDGGAVIFDGAAGEQNVVGYAYDTFDPGQPYVVVHESGAGLKNDAGAGCTNTDPGGNGPDPQTAWCQSDGVTAVVMNGGDQNDTISPGACSGVALTCYSSFFSPSTFVTVNGGDGNDSVTTPSGTTSDDTPPPQPQAVANGDGGNDSVNVRDGQTGNGGDGDDTVSNLGTFAGEKAPFAAAQLFGNNGNDALNAAGTSPDHLDGGAGDDVLFPATGDEDLIGGPGGDVVNWNGVSNGVNVSLDNVANDGGFGQKANAHSDIETLLGTTGFSDVLTGAPVVPNFIDGRGGNDTFNVANNPPDADIVACGDGFVTINADVLDTFDTAGPSGCRGNINRPSTAPTGPTVSISRRATRLTSDHYVPFLVGCRGSVRCRVLLEVDQGSTVIGTAQAVIPSGKTKKVNVLPRPSAVKRLRRGKSIKATVTVDATDNANTTPTTVSRKVTIKGTKKHRK